MILIHPERYFTSSSILYKNEKPTSHLQNFDDKSSCAQCNLIYISFHTNQSGIYSLQPKMQNVDF